MERETRRRANQPDGLGVTSCLYEGRVRHRRIVPRPTAFTNRLLMVYLDLEDLDEALATTPFLRRGRFGWASFHRPDHLGDPHRPLIDCARELVAERTGRRPEGPVRLLTHPRHFGFAFNPVSFFFCFETADGPLQAVIAEVSNTPWGERHCYVLTPDVALSGRFARVAKAFHVSPFMPMEQCYDWIVHEPEESLRLAILSSEAEEEGQQRTVFAARLVMRRLPLRRTAAWLRFPAMTLQVLLGIYFRALRLFLTRLPFHPHPRRRSRTLGSSS